MPRSTSQSSAGLLSGGTARARGRRRAGLLEDLDTAYRRDPALREGSRLQALLYPGVQALALHRVSHRLWRGGHAVSARALSQLARALTGIEIHPGAQIGRRCFIDHGAGVVIGETAVIGDDVTMYHGVTLGGRGWWRDPKGSSRHPSIGDGVTLGAGATVIGPVRIGDRARIGPLALVLADVPAGAHVRAPVAEVHAPRPADPPRALPGEHAPLTNGEAR